ncbi:hypothetical protein T10_6327 [Trichinella papuae]|uniref:Uncharacterized protein n=1 Tax=Trichinella papuae TaxID=268474 RepID=A0A0V1M0W2_9BILA|nr:hypothetical protein T10_4277 [Trichinella papuae]KRZ72749.1 hypothetical protein T10_6327 [Trichinella papuae]
MKASLRKVLGNALLDEEDDPLDGTSNTNSPHAAEFNSVCVSTYMGVDKENELCRLWFVLGISASYATLRLKFHGTVGQSQHGLLRLFDRYTLN